MSRLGYEKPSAPKAFVAAVDEALREIVASDTSPDVLGRFLLAYRHRRNFSWLPESGQNPEAGMQDGLVCAFRYALAEYIPGRSQYAEFPTGDSPVSEEERERVEEAASAVVDDHLSLLQFSNGLSAGGCDPGRIDFQELKQHIILALEEYYLLRESATSPDPW